MNSSPALVSVIIPSYNAADFVGEAVASVLSQSYQEFEIILIDDGSTDNTNDVINSFVDDRINYVYQENRGLSGARNTGIRKAAGKYISFLDADDFYFPNKLEDQVGFLEQHPDVGLVVGDFIRINLNGTVRHKGKTQPGFVTIEDVITENRFIVHSTLIRKTCIDKTGFFDEKLAGSEEWDYHSRLAINGCSMYHAGRMVCAYRLRPGSLSTDPELQTKYRLAVCEKIYSNVLLPRNLMKCKASSLGRIYLKGSVQFYYIGQIEKGKDHLAHSIENDPSLVLQNYKGVLDKILSWIGPLGMRYPIAFFRTFFRNLPLEANDMLIHRKVILGVVAKRELIRAIKQKKILLGFQAIFWALISNPLDLIQSVTRKIFQIHKGK